jgi:hypothetical protein
MFNAKLLISLSVLFISFSGFAKPINEFFKDSGGDNYIVSYSEEGKWILDHIVVRPGELQEKISSKVFNTEIRLKSYKASKYGQQLRTKSRANKARYVTTESSQKIWEVKNSWDQNWEKKFSQWLESEFNKDFFTKYNLETDCADVAFALRWIFARNNNLPAANTLAGSHMIFSQDSFKSQWSNLKKDKEWHKDEVFMAAVRYLMLHAFTGTLNIDGYPIEINKDSFLVGTIHLTGGHTMIINKIDYSSTLSAPIYKLSSTVPSAVRTLYEQIMIDSTAIDEQSGGLFRMRWPKLENGKWTLIPKKLMPLYSKEQYNSEFLGEDNHFTLAIIKRLGIKFNPKKVLTEAALSVVNSIKQRIKIVKDGFEACLILDCSEGSFEYEEYSTPTRDARIADNFIKVDKLVKKFGEFDVTLKKFWNDYKKTTTITVNRDTKSLQEFAFIFANRLASYDPEDSIDHRWAKTTETMTDNLINNLSRLNSRRSKLISAAANCVLSKSCIRGSDEWETHNTYEFDLMLQEEIYNPYIKLCNKYKCAQYFSDSLLSDLNRIPFYISEPNYELRSGEQVLSKEYYQLPLGNVYIQTSDQTFIIDSGIYNYQTNMFDPNWSSTGKTLYNEKFETYIGMKKSNIIYKRSSENLKTLKMPFEVKDLKIINTDYLIASSCDSANQFGCYVSIIQVTKDDGIKIVREFTDVSNLNIRSENTKKEKSKTALSLHITDSQQLGPTKLFVFDASLMKEINYENAYNIEVNLLENHVVYKVGTMGNNYKFYEMYNIETSHICRTDILTEKYVTTYLDGEILGVSQNGVGSKYYTVSGDCQLQFLYESQDESEWAQEIEKSIIIRSQDQFGDLTIINNKSVIKIKNKKDYFHNIQTGSELIWLKLDSDYKKVLDAISLNYLTGEELQEDPYNIPFACTDNFCQSKNENLKALLHYKKTEEYSYSYAKLEIDGVILNTLLKKQSNDSSGEYSVNAIEQYIKYNTGTLLSTFENSYIYIP